LSNGWAQGKKEGGRGGKLGEGRIWCVSQGRQEVKTVNRKADTQREETKSRCLCHVNPNTRTSLQQGMGVKRQKNA